jgi:predicted cupin superfamily sugar epimerase
MPVDPTLSADDIVELLKMQPHPEGGFYAETFRDDVTNAQGRAASTLIYFLLPDGVVSRWHKVDAVETWHWYGGAALELSRRLDCIDKQVIQIGNDLV